MEKYFKRKSIIETSQLCSGVNDNENQPSSKKNCFKVDLENLPFDHGFRPRITFYHPNVRDQVRMRYLQKGLCQPRNHKFPKSKSSDHERSFQRSWFDKYSTGWNIVLRKMLHIVHVVIFSNQIKVSKAEMILLFLMGFAIERDLKIVNIILEGLPFRGHDESDNSTNQGNFLELLYYTAEQNEEYRLVALENAPGHEKLLAPNMTALSLKMGIKTLFSKYNFGISRLRGQGYDGATLVAVAKKDTNIERLFLKVSFMINIVGWSRRRQDLLNEKQALKVKKAIESVLEDLTENSDNRVEASDLVDYMTSFYFAFNLHMIKNILGITFELSQALRRKDQDIINARSFWFTCRKEDYC
ncbi:uncharacterized protein LOC116123179 [Pistacia vera]|uniref:uncharacterized protein LOC116123179 n=1 Tax=Pistacia vera TaxID=55513 RepID=UPI001262AF76|nr:uncharacterized protein LOC116123179 [Pistacia vera]